jgi:branched-chain amino acid aminotransferase
LGRGDVACIINVLSVSREPLVPVENSRVNPETATPATSGAKWIWLNGNLVAPEQASVSVFDHGLLYGDGAFEGIRAYGGRIFKLRSHLKRLFDSAKALRLTIPYSLDELTAACRATLEANEREHAYIRLCVTRGIGTLGIHPFKCSDPQVFIIVDSISLYPDQLYSEGMSVVTASTVRNHPASLSPRIKSMNYLNNILAKIEAIDAGVLEAVMLNFQGYVAECTGDNICIVRQVAGRPTLMTPPLHAGALEGVTLDVVQQLAEQLNVPMQRQDLTKHDLYTADEMFLTGTAAEIMPVTQVDNRAIGDGEPGPITRQLSDAFWQLVKDHAPED